jgi:phosphodiester glycosidase/flagellar hook capping protein FlgD
MSLSPDWSALAGAVGGGPLLVRNGKPVFHAGEAFGPRQLNVREPRGAVGQLPDGRILLVSVEGTNPAYSIGMSSYELAVELSRLGATTAFGLGAGPSAGMAFDGTLLTKPWKGLRPKVSDALVLSYSGVYVALPPSPVLSPNGDGVGDTETLSYRLARPSTVTATLSGPGGTKITLASGAEPAGLETITWNGTNGASPAPEGSWTFAVTATDDRNVTTSASRPFSLDETLSSLAVRPGGTATFKLARAADVVVRVERPNGVPVATVRSGPLSAGPQHATWKGRIAGRRAQKGRYRIDVQATSSVGSSSLSALFSFRPHSHK